MEESSLLAGAVLIPPPGTEVQCGCVETCICRDSIASWVDNGAWVHTDEVWNDTEVFYAHGGCHDKRVYVWDSKEGDNEVYILV